MKKLFILAVAATLGTFGCDRDDRSEAREDAREAREEVREEARDAGNAIERGAEDAAARMPDDDRLDPRTKDHEQYVGTVTRFDTGKVLSIETASGDNQSFDLDETGTKVNLPASVKKGSKVQVTIHRDGNKKTISVVPQS